MKFTGNTEIVADEDETSLVIEMEMDPRDSCIIAEDPLVRGVVIGVFKGPAT